MSGGNGKHQKLSSEGNEGFHGRTPRCAEELTTKMMLGS